MNTEIELDAKSAAFEELKSQIYAHFRRLAIDELLKTDGVTEICINEPKVVYYEQFSIWKRKDLENVAAGNNSDDVIRALGRLLISASGQKQDFDEKNPMLSLTMPDGERVQLVRQPAAEHASLTIRIPSKQVFTMDEYAEKGLFKKIKQTDGITDEDRELKELLEKEDYQQFMEKAVQYRKNIVVSGATGSGKTTFMKTLISKIDHSERIITIEDARELFIDHPNRVHLVYPKSKSESSVTAKSCLEATLRMKPDRIILAEVRGDEAFYFIRACGNGHSGSITSCHADSALMAYEQLALMIAASNDVNLSYGVIKHLIMMTIDISIHFANDHGDRFITSVDFEPERKLKLLRGEKLD
ncbi:MAG: P-type DNA transfer ATPase VirB11 [Neisseriaceae bacterium]|nr:P-type DNA transfer ATPase VirB11 [Neisseriaceae bacterium]